MMQIGLVFPLAQNFVRPPPSPGPASDWAADPMLFVYVMGALLLGILVLLLIRRRTRVPDFAGQAILVDGSNVMHWQDNTPSLDPLQQVVRELSLLGLKPGVVFDANVGYKLEGRFLGERELAIRLGIPAAQIMVVPKGTQADPYLLDTARELQARIVTNDRFRDWVTDYPEVKEPGLLVSGGVQAGRVWLDGVGQGAL
jgi:hypothetical protein